MESSVYDDAMRCDGSDAHAMRCDPTPPARPPAALPWPWSHVALLLVCTCVRVYLCVDVNNDGCEEVNQDMEILGFCNMDVWMGFLCLFHCWRMWLWLAGLWSWVGGVTCFNISLIRDGLLVVGLGDGRFEIVMVKFVVIIFISTFKRPHCCFLRIEEWMVVFSENDGM